MNSLVQNMYAWACDAIVVVGTFVPEGRTERVGIVRLMCPEVHDIPEWPSVLRYTLIADTASGATKAIVFYDKDVADPFVAADWHSSCLQFVDAAVRYDMYVVEVYTYSAMSRVLVQSGEVIELGRKPIDKEEFDLVSDMVIDVIPNAPGGGKA